MRPSKSFPSFEPFRERSGSSDGGGKATSLFEFSRHTWRVIVLLVVWYGSSSFQNIWGKAVLKKLPRPMTLAMAQFAVINVVVPLLMNVWNKRRRRFDMHTYRTALIPLSLLKLVASVSTFFTLLKVPVKYMHTVKALMPLCSVTLSRWILGEHHSWKLCSTLAPIVLGVVIASATEFHLDVQGLLTALTSTLLLSSQTIFSKKAMLNVDYLNLLLVTSQLCWAMFTPIWLWKEGWALLFGDTIAKLGFTQVEIQHIMLQLLAASILNATQTVAAFTFLSLVPPVTYSIANVSKRVVIISLSMIYFGQSASMANMFGMGLTFLGVGLYNYVKIQEAAEKKKYALPTKRTESGKTPEWVL